MKRILVVAVLVGLILAASGCGVWMNGTYSQILDRTVSLSAETASRAEHNGLTPDEAKAALVLQAKTWKLFQDARDGKTSTVDANSPSAAAPSALMPANTTPPPAMPPVAVPAAPPGTK